MRAINHSLTGAIIGLSLADPLLAVPLAIVSHYIMDAIPHYGEAGDNDYVITTPTFKLFLAIDALLCAGLVIAICIVRPLHWPMAIVCAFLAAAPDLLSINRFYKALKKIPYTGGLYRRFAGGIQWFEKPVGAVVEVVWLGAAIYCVSIFMHR